MSLGPKSLPERALKYIEKLEAKLEELEARSHRTEDRLRKANLCEMVSLSGLSV